MTRTVATMMQLAALLTILIAAPTLARSQSRDTTKVPPRVIGIYDGSTGQPLPGVQVRDAFSGDYAMSTMTGTVALTFVTFRGAAGLIELKKPGYRPKRIYLGRNDTTPITEVLEPVSSAHSGAAQTLAPVITTEKYRIDRDPGLWDGFAARCSAKNVTCVRDSTLAAHPLSNIADFLVRAPGITMGSCGLTPGAGTGHRSAQCGHIAMHSLISADPYCEPTFYVNGYEWNPKLGPPVDVAPNKPADAPYNPTNVKGLEVYLPEQTRPMRYAGDPNCGAVVIWTR